MMTNDGANHVLYVARVTDYLGYMSATQSTVGL